MNKKMLALSMVAALAAIPAASMAAPPDGNWFISGQVGESQLQGMSATNDTATGSAFMAGYRWNINPMFQLGAEAGYANTGTFKDTYNGTTANAKLEGMLAGVTGKVNFTPNWYLNFEGGFFNAKQTTSGTTTVGNSFYS
jgi:OOP family OmpA-OmpF porin